MNWKKETKRLSETAVEGWVHTEVQKGCKSTPWGIRREAPSQSCRRLGVAEGCKGCIFLLKLIVKTKIENDIYTL